MELIRHMIQPEEQIHHQWHKNYVRIKKGYLTVCTKMEEDMLTHKTIKKTFQKNMWMTVLART